MGVAHHVEDPLTGGIDGSPACTGRDCGWVAMIGHRSLPSSLSLGTWAPMVVQLTSWGHRCFGPLRQLPVPRTTFCRLAQRIVGRAG